MKISEIVESLGLNVATKDVELTEEVTGGYSTDLLSNVMGQASAGMVWVTMQGHQNIAAVAALLGLSAVIVAGGTAIEQETLNKAEKNDVLILTTNLSTFEVVGKIYALGVKNIK